MRDWRDDTDPKTRLVLRSPLAAISKQARETEHSTSALTDSLGRFNDALAAANTQDSATQRTPKQKRR